jgi:hypothetical protein
MPRERRETGLFVQKALKTASQAAENSTAAQKPSSCPRFFTTKTRKYERSKERQMTKKARPLSWFPTFAFSS